MMRTELGTWASRARACDVLVIGGGATGLRVALLPALECRRVPLVEARGFACGTPPRPTTTLAG